MYTGKAAHKVRICGFLMLISLNVQTAESHRYTQSIFYDFQYKEGPTQEKWENVKNEVSYRYRSQEHFGAMLIHDGFTAIPLGYGNFDIVKDGIFQIDRTCPGCREKFRLESCAFNNCYYRIKGKKNNGTWVIRPWAKVNDSLEVFHDTKNLCEYVILKFECRRLTESKPDDDDL